MATCEYSFGSRVLLTQTATVCNDLVTKCELSSLRNCLLLMYAQRSRLTEEEKAARLKPLLEALAKLEVNGTLTARDKFVGLFMMQQIESENKAILKTINRKMKRTKEIYKSEMVRLLPPPRTRTNLRFSIDRKRGLTGIDRVKP